MKINWKNKSNHRKMNRSIYFSNFSENGSFDLFFQFIFVLHIFAQLIFSHKFFLLVKKM
jgi:hypothetical protein